MSDDTLRLHRIHAAPSTGNSLDVGDTRWRPVDGGTHEAKRAQAFRMAFTWNMAEGIPTAALEAGCVARFYVAVQDLLDAIRAGEQLDQHVALVQSAYDAHQFDRTGGRLHDCEGCHVGEGESDAGSTIDVDPEAAEGAEGAEAEVAPITVGHRCGQQGELF